LYTQCQGSADIDDSASSEDFDMDPVKHIFCTFGGGEFGALSTSNWLLTLVHYVLKPR
jgi:hypothetical protein